MTTTKIRRKEDTVNMKTAYYLTSLNFSLIVRLRQGSGKERQGKARIAKGERP